MMEKSGAQQYEPVNFEVQGKGYIPLIDRKKNLQAVWAGVFGLLGGANFYLANYYYRRPLYSGLLFLPAWVGSFAAIGYGLGALRKYNFKQRDAVVDHYMQLHPEDFADLAKASRKWKDVLLPWEPIRPYQQRASYVEKTLDEIGQKIEEEYLRVPETYRMQKGVRQ